MAILIPEAPDKGPNSERHIFERLGNELPADWVVLHSLGLPGHETKIWGEADIVVLSPLGVFVLEVKGGTVECSDGLWTVRGDFDSYTKKESPWAQASGALEAVRKALCAADPLFRDVMFGFGVLMPYTEFNTAGAEIISEVLLDKRNVRQSLKLYISALQKFWDQDYFQKRGRRYKGLEQPDIRAARQILRPNLETALSLGSYLTGVESRIVQLTNEQIRASRRMSANPRTIVRGGAGTGKSVLAQDRAKHLAAQGQRVLYLSYNQLLARHVAEAMSNDPAAKNVEVRHVHGLYRELIDNAGMLGRLEAEDPSNSDFFPILFPQLAVEALCDRPTNTWDTLVVDEAQDLLTTEHLDVFDLLLTDGLRRGRWHIFFDPQQNIYSREIEEEFARRINEIMPTFDDLTENCRSTAQIASEVSIISSIDLPYEGAPKGPDCERHYFRTVNEGLDALDSLIRELIEQDVRPEDIVILSSRRHENSMLAGRNEIAGRKLFDPIEKSHPRPGEIVFTTMHAFKGLERQVVVAIDMAEIGNPNWSMLHYAGLSRACCLLHVLAPISAKEEYSRQAREFGRRLAARVIRN